MNNNYTSYKYLYKDNSMMSSSIISLNVLPLFYDDINNTSYLYKDGDKIKKMIVNNEFSHDVLANYVLLNNINLKGTSLKEVLSDKTIQDQLKGIFLNILSYSRDTTMIYREWVGDINKSIIRKKIDNLKCGDCNNDIVS